MDSDGPTIIGRVIRPYARQDQAAAVKFDRLFRHQEKQQRTRAGTEGEGQNTSPVRSATYTVQDFKSNFWTYMDTYWSATTSSSYIKPEGGVVIMVCAAERIT
uniref:Uncharacterized protein n=1 Tax=Leersia perrieri TaxID=77586 RepID=A0A0D9X8D3_9ORYZ